MITTLKKFFDFCDNKNRRMFYRALAVGVFIAVCEAVKFPAIYLVLDGFLSDAISGGRILVGFLILFVSVIHLLELLSWPLRARQLFYFL